MFSDSGEKYILVDAGGATVDIAYHEMVEVDSMGVTEMLNPSTEPWEIQSMNEKRNV